MQTPKEGAVRASEPVVMFAEKCKTGAHPDLYSQISAGLIVLIYLGTALKFARIARLWMDEVLSAWLIRRPSVSQIYQGLLKGSETSPPGYPVLLHGWVKIAGGSDLAMRLPSIVAILVTALVVFSLLRRYLDYSVAVLGLSLALSGTLYAYALQVRPYALTVACYAIVLLLWEGLHRKPDSQLRAIAIALAMSAALAMHYYCTLYVVSLCAVELLYAARFRRFRPAVWGSFVVSGLSVVLWLPLAHRISKFLHADQGPAYFGTPTLNRLLSSVVKAFCFGRIAPVRGIFYFVELPAFILCLLLFFIKRNDIPQSDHKKESSWPLVAIALGTILLPFITFLFSLFVSKAYNERYVLPSVIGAVLLTCMGMDKLPYRQALCLSIALLTALTMFSSGDLPMAKASSMPQVFAAAKQPYPVAVAEGVVFFQEMEDPALSSADRSRIVYLTLPADYRFPDATNEHEVARWKDIESSLPVFSADSYLAKRDCFYEFDTHKTSDDLTSFLPAHGAVFKNREWVGDGELIEVCPASSK